MGSEDRKPSLEPPSLGFRKRRRKSAPEPGAVVRDEPVVGPAEEPAGPEPVEREAAEPEAVEPEAVVAQTVVTEPVTGAEPSGDTVVEAPGDEPETEAVPVREATLEEVLAEETAVETPEPPADQPAPPAGTTKPPKPSRAPRKPLNAHLAAGLTGLVVGAFLVLATAGGLAGCEQLRGTSSCGGPGFLLLVAVLALAVILGGYLLRWARIPSAGSISFLAVALVAVLSVLFLLDSLEEVSGAVTVGVLTVAAYLLSHWVTVRYIDTVE